MKGLIFPIALWSLVLSPLAFAALGASRRTFVWCACSLTIVCLAGWWTGAYYGWRLTENQTTSLSGHLYAFQRGAPFVRGDLVAYRWRGGASYPVNTIFIKRAEGMPGDRVVVRAGAVWVAGRFVGVVKARSLAGYALSPVAGGTIPAGEYFMATPHPDSLDSRYALSGNIKQAEILGRAYELL